MRAKRAELRLRWVYLVCLLLGLSCPLAAGTAAEQDRQELLSFFRKQFPAKPLEDYVYGALMFSSEGRAQYDAIMEFPPFLSVIEQGKRMWETPFGNGKRYSDCFPEPGIAGTYPRYDEQLGRVVTLENAINECRRENGAAELSYDSMSTMGVLMAYARTLSDGTLMRVRVDSPAAQEKFAAGKREFFARRGQYNFACASCHINYAGRTLRDEVISPVIGQATHFPVFRNGGDELLTIQGRYRRCYVIMRAVPPPLGGEVMNNLEYFHSYLSNGLPLKASVYRK